MQPREAVLQDYVVPICHAEISAGRANLTRLEGTAFFINEAGIYLTAGHVVRAVVTSATQSNQVYGLNVKGHSATNNLFTPLLAYEFAPAPFDIAIGIVDHRSKSWFTPYTGPKIEGWLDIATLGYPASALNTSPEKFNIHLRLLKGYVQRPISADELPAHIPHPDCFELNFPIPNGLSGSPLFTPQGTGQQQLVGVCVSSFDSEIVVDEVSEIDDRGNRFSERRARIEQYGIAHSILPLLDWAPPLLKGRALRDVIVQSG
jgi:hypothetical protein